MENPGYPVRFYAHLCDVGIWVVLCIAKAVVFIWFCLFLKKRGLEK